MHILTDQWRTHIENSIGASNVGRNAKGSPLPFGGPLGKALDAMSHGTHGTPGMLGSMDVHPQSNIVFQRF